MVKIAAEGNVSRIIDDVQLKVISFLSLKGGFLQFQLTLIEDCLHLKALIKSPTALIGVKLAPSLSGG